MWIHTPKDELLNLDLVKLISVNHTQGKFSDGTLIYAVFAYSATPQGMVLLVEATEDYCKALVQELSLRIARQEHFYDAREFQMPSDDVVKQGNE